MSDLILAAKTFEKRSPLVSVIIPIYNRAKEIQRSLNSVRDQTHRPIEIVAIDDGSTDGSAHAVESWSSVNHVDGLTIKLIRQFNSGAPAARNRGMRIAAGEYLQFLDSDDTIEPEKIARQISALMQTGGDVAVCDFRYIYEDHGNSRSVLNDGDLLRRLALGWSVSTPTPLITSTLVRGQIEWDEKLRRQQDMDFLFKVLMLSSKHIYTPGVWCNYIHHQGVQISDDYARHMPQYGRRVLNQIRFMIVFYSSLSRSRRKLIFLSVLYLVRSSVRSLIKVILVRTFGRSAVENLKKRLFI